MAYTNSPLVTYTNITKNKTSPRNHEIDTITIHCIVGQWTAKQGCDYFARTTRQCSSNYVVGNDGSIGLSVDEKDRSWCSSSSSNDNRAITIEVASDTKHPYAVTDAAYKALIELVADICKRNNIKELKWKADKSLIGQVDKQNMTVHRWFANKSCPGEYLYERHSDIADKVNKILNPDVPAPQPVDKLKVGDIVNFTGNTHYSSANASKGSSCKPGKAKITSTYNGKHPYHLVAEKDGGSNVYGWVDTADIKVNEPNPQPQPKPEVKPEPKPEDKKETFEMTLPVLRKGDKNATVKSMQTLLIGNGCSCGSCGADGSYGGATYNAVVAYQKKVGLGVDGVCGPKTWAKLLGV